MKRKTYAILLTGILITACAVKGWIVLAGHVPFNADEAIVALMARHITQGKFPIFFYGQSYLGSLDALLVAGGFQLFGEHVWVIRLIQGVLYAGTIVTTAAIGRRVFESRKVGLLSGLLLAAPTVNIALYTTASLGGYGEALLIGNLILLLTLRIGRNVDRDVPLRGGFLWFLWGGAAGLGLWVFGLTLVYIIPAGFFLFYKLINKSSRRHSLQAVSAAVAGGLLGSAPWWIFAMQEGVSDLMLELTGSAIAGATQVPVLLKPLIHIYYFLLFGITVIFGLRPPWGAKWLMLPLAPFAIIFWFSVSLHMVQSIRGANKNKGEKMLLVSVIGVTILGFIFTSFGADPSGRYFLPLAPFLALFAADLILSLAGKRPTVSIGLTVFVLLFNAGGILQSTQATSHGLTTQFDPVARLDRDYDRELINFLLEQDIRRGYTNYWVAYPLAFRSQEELIFVPELPYHHDFRYTSRDNRYQPYQDMVDRSPNAAYITTNHRPLNQYLRRKFQELDVKWSEKIIGDYTIFYGLDRKVIPEDIGLGETN